MLDLDVLVQWLQDRDGEAALQGNGLRVELRDHSDDVIRAYPYPPTHDWREFVARDIDDATRRHHARTGEEPRYVVAVVFGTGTAVRYGFRVDGSTPTVH